VGTRQISLNGIWQYDPEAWVTLSSGDTSVEDTTNLPGNGEMTIPGHWQGTPLQSFDGRVRFTRTFNFDGGHDGEASVWLVFKGVDYVARVSLNGTLVGEHAGYFQTFELDVTGAIQAGENHLEVEVTCPREEPGTVWPDKKVLIKGILNHWDARPGSWDHQHGQDQNSGGIWNDVWLETRSVAWVGHAKVTSKLVPRHAPEGMSHQGPLPPVEGESEREGAIPRDVPKQAFVLIDIELHGAPGTYDLRVSIGDEPTVVRTVHLSSESRRHTVVVQIPDPKLWWTWDLGAPHLEPCRIELLREDETIHSKTIEIGIREIEFDPKRGEWWLNGTRVFIRGTNVIPSLWLGQYDQATIDKDIALLRDAHVNGVRVCVHVNREEFYTACDQAGILVWQDFALQWGYAETLDVMRDAVRQIRDMVRLLVNHPSIALWCCQNESTFHNKQILDPVLAAAVSLEDGSRYIRPTSEYSEHTYVGWYRGHYRDYSALPATPVLTEFGAQAFPSPELTAQFAGTGWPPDWDRLAYHNFQYDQTFHVAGVAMGDSWEEFIRNSQIYQARLLKFSIEQYRKAKYEKLGGLFQFMFMDAWPAVTWSVVDSDRQPKPGYDALREAYQPVLIGCDRDREVVITGVDRGGHERPLVINPWIINDLHSDLTGCTCGVELSGPGGRFNWNAEQPIDIGADATLVHAPAITCDLPEQLAPGDYQLTLTLHHDNDFISRNRYDLSVGRIPTGT